MESVPEPPAPSRAASSTSTSPSPASITEPPKKKVSDIVVTDANVAINVLAGFVTLAQQRGCFSIEESSKIWEAICMLEKASKEVN